MLTDYQSLKLTGIVLMSFVLFGMFGILDNIIITCLLLLGFIIVVINLFLTKRIPEAEEDKEIEELKKAKKIEEETFSKKM